MVPTIPRDARMMAHARDEPLGRIRNMHMALSTHRWTRADLERLPDDGNKYEIVNGELLVSPAPRPSHDYIKVVLRRRLEGFCDTLERQSIFVESAFVHDDSEAVPDLSVRERIMPPPARWEDAPAPILVVEITSESTRRYDEVKKRAFYMESGVPEYWIVDGKARTIRVVTPTGERLESVTLRWMPRADSKPFDLDVRALFEESLGSG
jgi:Uma2 family endonuclease